MNNAAHWTVPVDHPAFAGHFPGTPILPGVVLLDAALQAIANASGIALDICEISSVKFLSPARPGDELLIRHAVLASGTIRFDIVAGMRKIASGSIVPNGHGNDAAPDNETRLARPPHSPLSPQAVEGANESLREFHVKSPL